jgi:hypothetical protein
VLNRGLFGEADCGGDQRHGVPFTGSKKTLVGGLSRGRDRHL